MAFALLLATVQANEGTKRFNPEQAQLNAGAVVEQPACVPYGPDPMPIPEEDRMSGYPDLLMLMGRFEYGNIYGTTAPQRLPEAVRLEVEKNCGGGFCTAYAIVDQLMRHSTRLVYHMEALLGIQAPSIGYKAWTYRNQLNHGTGYTGTGPPDSAKLLQSLYINILLLASGGLIGEKGRLEEIDERQALSKTRQLLNRFRSRQLRYGNPAHKTKQETSDWKAFMDFFESLPPRLTPDDKPSPLRAQWRQHLAWRLQSETNLAAWNSQVGNSQVGDYSANDYFQAITKLLFPEVTIATWNHTCYDAQKNSQGRWTTSDGDWVEDPEIRRKSGWVIYLHYDGSHYQSLKPAKACTDGQTARRATLPSCLPIHPTDSQPNTRRGRRDSQPNTGGGRRGSGWSCF